VHVVPGSEIKVGTKLLDLRLDLGSAAPQDCTPISFFRIVAREKGWLRQLAITEGEVVQVGQSLALVSSVSEGPLDLPPARTMRITTASILGGAEWLTNSGPPSSGSRT
jgi:hypothetical protein